LIRTIVHLSDLHLGAFDTQDATVVEPLLDALGEVHEREALDAFVCTGDLFETSSVTVAEAVRTYRSLVARLRDRLGRSLPLVFLPGNHDRRARGLIGPHNSALFKALAGASDDRTLIAGCATPFLAEVVDPALHGLRWLVASFDSSYLPTGWISAGGILRQDDLLMLADRINDAPSDVPLLLLTHHHIVPTPLTDLSRVDVNTQSVVWKWAARNVLARLLSNADHEEMMMTALGAGTALSTLHAYGRPVVVLHGHKHFPVARALAGPHVGHGDVLLLSAGSAGTSLSWNESDLPDIARLWPSFNVLTIEEEARMLGVDVVAFKPESPGDTRRRSTRRPLLRARAEGSRWRVTPVHGDPIAVGSRMRSLEATAKIEPNAVRGGTRADLQWTLRAERADATDEHTYVIVEDRVEGAVIEDLSVGETMVGRRELPAKIEVPTDGTRVTYRMVGGLCLTRTEATIVRGELSAFEDVALLNRYESDRTELRVLGLGEDVRAFGSVLDLTTGHERPVPVVRADDGAVLLALSPCPTRTLLQIRWPLLRA
jgi:3',5'-cyclic AMP phosphodiesterase CpdA